MTTAACGEIDSSEDSDGALDPHPHALDDALESSGSDGGSWHEGDTGSGDTGSGETESSDTESGDPSYGPEAVSTANRYAIMDAIVAAYRPEADAWNVDLTWRVLENYDAASIHKNSERWLISMGTGLLEHPGISDDTFALVMCHEMGHFVGGFPFKDDRGVSAEAQSDYFATKDCLPRMWRGDPANADSEQVVDPIARAACDGAWGTPEERWLCYRTSVAALGFGSWLGPRRGKPNPSYANPETTATERTLLDDPSPQCRIDTLFAGALCSVPNAGIPGLVDTPWGPGVYSPEVEAAAEPFSCPAGTTGARPSCWFRPQMPLDDCEGIPPSGACVDEDHLIVCTQHQGPLIQPCDLGCVDDENGGGFCRWPDEEWYDDPTPG